MYTVTVTVIDTPSALLYCIEFKGVMILQCDIFVTRRD